MKLLSALEYDVDYCSINIYSGRLYILSVVFNNLKGTILFLLICSLLASCGPKELIDHEKITGYSIDNNHYVNIVFTSHSNIELNRISFDNIEILEQYQIEAKDINTIEEWEAHRLSSLPIALKKGKKYSIVSISQDKSFSDFEVAVFILNKNGKGNAVEILH